MYLFSDNCCAKDEFRKTGGVLCPPVGCGEPEGGTPRCIWDTSVELGHLGGAGPRPTSRQQCVHPERCRVAEVAAQGL